MIKYLETTGRTEDDAIASALRELGMERDDVSVEILERAKSGFLGIGAVPARVRVSWEVPDAPVEEPKAEPVKPVAEVQKPAAEPAKPVVEVQKPAEPAAPAPVDEPEDAIIKFNNFKFVTVIFKDLACFFKNLCMRNGCSCNLDCLAVSVGNIQSISCYCFCCIRVGYFSAFYYKCVLVICAVCSDKCCFIICMEEVFFAKLNCLFV